MTPPFDDDPARDAETIDLDADQKADELSPDQDDEFQYTDDQLDAISQAIKPYLASGITWESELCDLTMTMHDICTRTQVLYTGDNQRCLDAMQTALQMLVQAYDRSPEPLRWHVQRQVCEYFPSLDGEPGPTVSSIMHVLRDVFQQAKRRPFDAPFACAQARGAPKNYAMVLLVTHLLSGIHDEKED